MSGRRGTRCPGVACVEYIPCVRCPAPSPCSGPSCPPGLSQLLCAPLSPLLSGAQLLFPLGSELVQPGLVTDRDDWCLGGSPGSEVGPWLFSDARRSGADLLPGPGRSLLAFTLFPTLFPRRRSGGLGSPSGGNWGGEVSGVWEAILAGVSRFHGASLFCAGASMLGPHLPSSLLFPLSSLCCSPARRRFLDLYLSSNFLSSTSSHLMQ